MKLLRDQVLIKISDEDEETRTASNIILPSSQKESLVEGEVVLVGQYSVRTLDGLLIPPSLSVGDRVLLHRNAGMEITVEGEKVRLMQENSIVAVLEPVVVGN